MEYITREDIQDLWEDLPTLSWEALSDTVHYYRDDTSLSPELVGRLLNAIEYFQTTGENFPLHEETLYTLLNTFFREHGFSLAS